MNSTSISVTINVASEYADFETVAVDITRQNTSPEHLDEVVEKAVERVKHGLRKTPE
jgi:hypothetical protein